MELKKAQRKQAKIKMALQGPSGSGKTFSSLLLASGITGYEKIGLIDTENHSADLYSHLGDFNVLQLEKPFTPERFIKAIEVCEQAGMEVIIIDSITHEWECILELHGNMPGNTFTAWNKVTPRHNAFVQKLLQSGYHIIATIRTKQDYTLTDKNGKMVPEKIGLKGVQRDGIDYEFTVVMDLDIKHLAKASKDRTGLFMDQPESVITAEYGKKILAWCNAGVSVSKIKKEIKSAKTIDQLREIIRTYPEYRKELEPLAIARKEQLSANIININKISGNGQQNDSSKSK